MDGFVVEKDAVGVFAVGAEALAMVGGDHEERVVVELKGFERGDEFADGGVGGRHRAVIGSWGCGLRVGQMDPEKNGHLSGFAEPGDGTGDDLIGAAPDHGGCSGLRGMEAGVVEAEPAIEAGGEAVAGVEGDGCDEGGGAVSLGVEQVRQVGKRWGESGTELGDLMGLRIGAGQQRGVRNHGQRGLGIGALEGQRLFGEGIEGGRFRVSAEKAHAIGAGGIEGDEDDVGFADGDGERGGQDQE